MLKYHFAKLRIQVNLSNLKAGLSANKLPKWIVFCQEYGSFLPGTMRAEIHEVAGSQKIPLQVTKELILLTELKSYLH